MSNRLTGEVVKKLIAGLVLSVLCLLSIQVSALTPDEIREKLLAVRSDLPVTDVRESRVPGLMEVTLAEGTVLFVNEDASYFIAGDLFRIEPDQFVNVSDEGRNGIRKTLLESLDETGMVVFSPAKGMKKTTITVFTDIDCGYCRKLHQEVPELNRLGVEVRYLAYPRSGLDTPSYDKAVSAWCADNPQLALTKAKLGQPIPEKVCENAVAAHYVLGNEMGVTGTPAIVYEDGTLQPGYLPAAQLAARLGIN